MKLLHIFFAACILCLMASPLFAQPVVKNSNFKSEEARFEMATSHEQSYQLDISGPNGYHFQQEVATTSDIRLSNQKANGEVFQDGLYTLQITPIFKLSEEDKVALQALRNKNDQAGIANYRALHGLPNKVDVATLFFSIREGKFVMPNKHEAPMSAPKMSVIKNDSHPALYASLNYVDPYTPDRAMDLTFQNGDAQVFTQDVIVQGSQCVGIDCTTTESFGFDTGRYKENNLRIHFDDTSASASFPSGDWRITINGSNNGDASFFAIDDATNNTRPMTISQGAGNNAIYVKDNGDVGLGTSSPVLELQVTDGDSPSIRLEQNGSNGWQPQSWDIAGNETNFFIRDVNNSSNLIFRLRAGAPANSIFVQNNGRVGFGTDSPSESMHLKSGNMRIESGNLTMNSGGITMQSGDITNESGSAVFQEGNLTVEDGSIGINVSPTVPLDVIGNVKVLGTSTFTGSINSRGSNTFLNAAGTDVVLATDGVNNRVGIGTSTPGHVLEVTSNDVVKPNGGDWLGASDRRLKTNIRNFEDGLATIMQIRPVRYNYNGKLGLPTDEDFVGVIAQEMQAIAPYTIKPLNHETEKNYLAYDGSSVTYMLVNAVQEQQAIIDAQEEKIASLEAQLSEVETLKAQMAQLSAMVQDMQSTSGEASATETMTEERD